MIKYALVYSPKILGEARLSQMLETEFVQSMLKKVFEDLLRDPGLSQSQELVRKWALLELMSDIEELIQRNCRKAKIRGKK